MVTKKRRQQPWCYDDDELRGVIIIFDVERGTAAGLAKTRIGGVAKSDESVILFNGP